MQHDFIIRSTMSAIKSKMGSIKSKIGRKFEQKKEKWVKEKANLVKTYLSVMCLMCTPEHTMADLTGPNSMTEHDSDTANPAG